MYLVLELLDCRMWDQFQWSHMLSVSWRKVVRNAQAPKFSPDWFSQRSIQLSWIWDLWVLRHAHTAIGGLEKPCEYFSLVFSLWSAIVVQVLRRTPSLPALGLASLKIQWNVLVLVSAIVFQFPLDEPLMSFWACFFKSLNVLFLRFGD